MSISDYLSIRILFCRRFNYTGYLGGSHFFCANPLKNIENNKKRGVSFDTTNDIWRDNI